MLGLMQEITGANPGRAEPGWPPVVVAGGFYTGVDLMRNLLRRGLQVYCVEWLRAQPCFRSVYGTSFQCPNPDEKPAEWLEFMIGVSARIGGKPVLISSADQFVTAIARHSAELEPHYRFCHAGVALQALLATKERQYDLANEHGLPVPRTRFVTSAADLAEFASTARFPCLLKPLHYREWERLPARHACRGAKLVLAGSAAELAGKYQAVAGVTRDWWFRR